LQTLKLKRETILTDNPCDWENSKDEFIRYQKRIRRMFKRKIKSDGERAQSMTYSFARGRRVKMYKHIIDEIRKYSDCPIALCRETRKTWKEVGLDSSDRACACRVLK